MSTHTLQSLTQSLGYRFNDPALLRQALTHRSMRGSNNERLELLGDSVLAMVITTTLFSQYPSASEGQLSATRATLVCEKSLVTLAEALGLADYIRLGASELGQPYKKRPALLADTLEAVIGAIYLDAGWSDCRVCVLNWYQALLATIQPLKATKDPKSALQEYLQGNGQAPPNYHLLSQTGKAHDFTFTVRCELAKREGSTRVNVQGIGKSRRTAEQDAAFKLLRLLGQADRVEYCGYNDELVTA